MPVDGFYITSDRPGAGRTALAAALATAALRDGRRAAYIKPGAPSSDLDVEFMRVLLKDRVAAQGVLPQEAEEAFHSLARSADVVLVEGPSLDADGATDLPRLLTCKVLLVLRYRRSLDADAIAQATGPLDQKPTSVLINGVPRYRMRALKGSLPTALEQRGVQLLGLLPEDRTLLAPTVAQLAEGVKARWLLNPEASDRLVEHVLVGGFIVEWGVGYFGRAENKAVLVRGDRPDLQMAALRTSTSCLVLTSGKEPVQYVRKEAEQLGVPVLLVDAGTQDAMEALGKLTGAGSIHHLLKAERFLELLKRHTEIAKLSPSPAA